ncbi:uncharacterized protein LOC125653146 [Ostrea edulis]|uniref:uncharacterized protein LOC125653146 n=1 Tax=Ostrea edulis TaxID=37623 RepID=UPI0024AF6954|nr:uncharacterized protein LOC125653146 [Ostrea edulis]
MAIYMYIELVVSSLLFYYGHCMYYNFQRDLCLETTLKFAMGDKNCNFTFSDANSSLAEEQTYCPYTSTCEVVMSNDYYYRQSHYRIETLQLIFRDQTLSIESCPYLDTYVYNYVYGKTLTVDCTKWTSDKEVVGRWCFLDTQCTGTINSGVCEDWRCVCKRGYISINGHCYEADVPLGHLCISSMQCTTSPFSGVCVNYKCACRDGYINHNSTCYPDNVLVGGACVLKEQCTGTNHSGVCKNRRCTCKEGYMSIEGDCYRADVPLGQGCEYDTQCTRSPFSGVCVNHTCACPAGYINYNNTCYPDNILVGGACDLDKQCTGTEHSGVCKNRRCTCQEGYVSIEGDCYRGNLSLNEPCKLNEQCSASPYAVCRNTTCTCEDGFTVVDTTSCVYRMYCITFLFLSNHVFLDKFTNFSNNNNLHELIFNTSSFQSRCSTLTIIGLKEIVPARSLEQSQADGNGPVSIVGALIGGLLGGVLITTIIVYIISRRSSTKVKKRQVTIIYTYSHLLKVGFIGNLSLENVRVKVTEMSVGAHGALLYFLFSEEPVAMFVANNSYGSNGNIERGSKNGSKDEKKPRKVVNVPPYACSADSPTYSNARDVAKQPTNEDVYNHLHEKETIDCDNDYDHTTGITGHVTEDSDYSHLHSGRGNMRLNLSVDDEYANTVPGDTCTDDYFTLEQQ